MMQSNEEMRELLSALMDGEATDDGAKFLAKRLEHDAALATQVGRWQFAGDVLRAAIDARQAPDLSTAIGKAIAAEIEKARIAQTAHKSSKHWWGGLAMAAAVGVVALTLQPWKTATPQTSPQANTVASTAVAPATVATVPAAVPAVIEPAVETPVPTESPHNTAVAAVSAPVAPVARPWRVPGDADALLAAAVRDTAPATPPEATAPARAAATARRQATMVASVPGAIRGNRDVEKVIRGKGNDATFDIEAAANPGWPRSLVPGANGAFNASFDTQGAAPFDPHTAPEH